MNDCEQLQAVLHSEIPLTREIGIRVTDCHPHRVELRAPLEPNINHKCTAFGGSLYSVAVLCGWSLVHQQLKLNHLKGHIVIHKTDVDYALPVNGEIKAVCELTDADKLKRFIKIYQKKQRARIELRVNILFNEQLAVRFNGQYVVHR